MNSFARTARVYVEVRHSSWASGLVFALSERNAHHVSTVLRLKPSDSVRVFDEANGEWLATIRNRSRIELASKIRSAPAATRGPLLMFSPLKAHRMQYLIEKATELGVRAFWPVFSERTQRNHLLESFRYDNHVLQSSVADFLSDKGALRQLSAPPKWSAWATEATEQSERLDVPSFLPAVDLSTAFTKLAEFTQTTVSPTRVFIADELTARHGLVAPATSHAASENPQNVLVIGPEGGWSSADRALFLSFKAMVHPDNAKAFRIKLSDNILRAETAAIAGLAILQQGSIFQDFE